MVSKVKVLFIIPTIHPGGIETYLLRFLTHFKKDTTISPIVLVRSFEKGHLFNQYNKLNIPIHFRPLGKINFSNILWYYRFFKNEKFDTICDFNANFSGITMFLAKTANIKNRLTFYRQGSNHFKNGLFKNLYNFFINRLVFKYSTQILSNSKASLDYYFTKWSTNTRFKIIYNGVEINDVVDGQINSTREELQIPLNAFVVCHSGRLDKAKNHNTILKVAKQLIQSSNNIYFILCGLGTEKLQNEIVNLGIDSKFRLLGHRNDVPKILNASNLFYFPSLTEGQPNALIEAMIVGIPVVASNIDSIKEMLPKELHRFLVCPLDTNNAVKNILSIKSNSESQDTERTKSWAKNLFSSHERFNDFYKVLTS
jgi:glycosyltransferase involved in cell wall biosynthesis